MRTAEQNTTELFLQYEKLLHKFAWSYRNTTGIEEEELFSEACVAYMTAIMTYDVTKETKLSTWISYCVKNRLNSFVSTFHSDKVFTVFDEEKWESFPANDMFDSIFSFSDIYKQLSPKAKFVCNMVLDAQETLDGIPPKLARGEIQRKLRQIGWVWSDIWGTFNELKRAFSNGLDSAL